jgi:branched-chain amino acid transport system ATP-binding protein
MIRPALEVRGISKNFGGLRATDDVSFSVTDGGITALIGPNGAGKTTLFNLITNIYSQDAGEVAFHGTSIGNLAPEQIAALGLVRTFQSARVFPGMTALENVMTGAHLRLRAHPLRHMLRLPGARAEERRLAERAEALLDLAGLLRFRDQAASELPMGTQKTLDVLRAVIARPRLLLLDEPAAGLNDGETTELAALLLAVRDSGVTIMLVEHNMPLVMGIADHVLVLDAGRLVAEGTPAEIACNKQVIAAYLGDDGEDAP